jgi:predicted NAD/FAD-binding protein
MNILQQVSDKQNYFVSINDPGLVDKSKVIRTIHYDHPIFTPETAAAQERLDQLNRNGVTYFCGSYFRFGFHEDALASAVDVCNSILGRDVWAEKTEEVRQGAQLITSLG